jgi:hypothetical protein
LLRKTIRFAQSNQTRLDVVHLATFPLNKHTNWCANGSSSLGNGTQEKDR